MGLIVFTFSQPGANANYYIKEFKKRFNNVLFIDTEEAGSIVKYKNGSRLNEVELLHRCYNLLSTNADINNLIIINCNNGERIDSEFFTYILEEEIPKHNICFLYFTCTPEQQYANIQQTNHIKFRNLSMEMFIEECRNNSVLNEHDILSVGEKINLLRVDITNINEYEVNLSRIFLYLSSHMDNKMKQSWVSNHINEEAKKTQRRHSFS